MLGVSGTDVVLVALTVVSLLATAALGMTVVQLRSVVIDLRGQVDTFEATAGPAATELADAAARAAHQVDRLEDLIGVASSLTGTMDNATAATVRVLSNPVIKTAALAKGTRRAARRLASTDET